MNRLLFLLFLFTALHSGAQTPLNNNETKVRQRKNSVTVTWPVKTEMCELVLNREPGKPLFERIAMGKKGSLTELATGVDPAFVLTVGSRTLKPENGWTIFFDKVPTRSYTSRLLNLEKRDIKITRQGKRTVIAVSGLSAADFKGDLEITIYNDIPLFNIAAVVSTEKDSTAILYDAGLTTTTPWKTVAFTDNSRKFRRIDPSVSDSATNLAVKYRTIIGANDKGGLAVFPPPHQYFYPLDEAFNLQSVWYGTNYHGMLPDAGIGIRLDPIGDKRYVPWFNAPPGTRQRLNFFCLLGTGSAESLMNEVKKFTHGDRYKPLDNYKTMASHFHNEFIMKVVLAGKEVPEDPEFAQVFRDMGVNIVHLGEFHYTAHPKGPDSVRLNELHTLFSQCRRLSGDDFLLLPGEEPNEFLGGHYMALFPHPVYWIMSHRKEDPFVTEDPDYGKVYRIGNKEEMLRLLETENGLVWTAHPRIKGSTGYPDKYKDETFFRSEHFLGGAWKAMPADLSRPRLGERVLHLMDDMNNWGYHKKVISEADLFTIAFENEMYAHMNINYLRMDSLPQFDKGWQPVLNTMSNGHFFSTTGEILLPSFTVNGKGAGEIVITSGDETLNIDLEAEWTFPLNRVEIISGDGEQVFHDFRDMSETEAFGSQDLHFTIPTENRKWIRVEVWDVATNGAFTQTVYLTGP